MSKALIVVGWNNAPHLSATARAELLGSYRSHEIDARTKGIPTLGSGAIYTASNELIRVDPFVIPPHFKRLCAIDFGVKNPALAWIAYDDELDAVFVYDCWRGNGSDVYSAGQLADVIKSRGEWIPLAWPHDGRIEQAEEKSDTADAATGVTRATLLRQKGINVLPEHAQHAEEGIGEETKKALTSVNGGIDGINDAMLVGRFKVFSHLSEWFAEKDFYHRKDGRIVKKRDHLLDATRYAFISRRFAITKPKPRARMERLSWKVA